jgi:hypothetical protein
VLVLLAGCGRHAVGVPVANQRPEVSLSGAPAPSTETTYAVRMRWTALDPDGEIASFRYAIDPPLEGDTTWTTTTLREATLRFPSTEPPDPLPPPGQRVTARDQHAFVLCAVDNEGLRSELVVRAFTSRTFVPWSTIFSPRPTSVYTSTLPRVTIRWNGADPDGIDGQPVSYRYRLIPAALVNPEYPDVVPAGGVQEYFGREAVAGFAGWDSTDAGHREVSYERLDADRTYLFAVSARDDAGADETRFMTASNVLFFKPTLNRNGPRMTVFSSFFRRTLTGGVSTDASRIIPVEVPSGSPLTFFWFGEPGSGTAMGGYRWALDIPDGNIADESPRENDQDFRHWSRWSLDETSVTLGPFPGTPGQVETHRLYVMGRDDVGFASLFTLELRVIAPVFDRPLLVIDDRYGTLGGPLGAFPTEAEEDTFHFAVGGVPDRYTGGTSVPGVFAGLDFDTLDYRTRSTTPGMGTGMPLSVLGRYRTVAWFTDNTSATAGSGTTVNPPPVALRLINMSGTLNTLAGYLRQGGRVLLFGEGTTVAIAGGYWRQFSNFPPQIPYTGNNVLRAGSFLYDYVHFRSSLSTTSLAGLRLQGAIPYLPEFRGPATTTDRSHDPRIGPGAERIAARWAGLPRLTMAAWRGANADPARRFVNLTWHVASPLRVIENGESVTDTLYLLQAETFDPAPTAVDGRPNAIHWHGAGHGPVVWLGFPLYYFEVSQARALVHKAIEVLERGE